MNSLIGILGVIALLLLSGTAIGVARPRAFSLKWLLAGAGLVVLNDFLLTRGYGLLPRLLPPTEWNWQGKLLALSASLVIASLPVFGWRQSGLTLAQVKGSLRSCIPIALIYCLFFIVLAHFFPGGPASAETIAFQLTMPGWKRRPSFVVYCFLHSIGPSLTE